MTGAATFGPAVAAVLAASGGYLMWSATRGERSPGPGRPRRWGDRLTRRRRSAAPTGGPEPGVRAWMTQAGLIDVTPAQFAGAVALAAVAGGLGAWLIFGGVAPILVAGLLTATFPVSAYRRRRVVALEAAAGAWPRLLEEIRLRTGSLGRSVPQALFEAARRGPGQWRPAFAAAEREWLLTTDFARTADLLKERLADPTADVVVETLLLAHEIGGTDLDAALSELIEDRLIDLEGRRDAVSRQAGVRFARRFVLLVPLGMALAGLSIGTGRQAYGTPGGQLAVVVGLAAVAACWAWSGRLMRMPATPRVFR